MSADERMWINDCLDEASKLRNLDKLATDADIIEQAKALKLVQILSLVTICSTVLTLIPSCYVFCRFHRKEFGEHFSLKRQ